MSKIKYKREKEDFKKEPPSLGKILYVWVSIPCVVVLILSFIISYIIFFTNGSMTGIYISAIMAAVMGVFFSVVSFVFFNKFPEDEKKRYSYLFDPLLKTFQGDSFAVKDGEFVNGAIVDDDGRAYEEIYVIFKREGISVCAREKKEILFEGAEMAQEKELSFTPYEECDFQLLYEWRNQHWDLLFCWKDKNSDKKLAQGAHHLSQDLFAAIKAFGVDKRVKDHTWAYLFYKPTAFFQELYRYMRIVN